MTFGDFKKKPNLVLFITDQQSGNPHWPAGWAEANLRTMQRLKRHGLTFTNGYTNSCTCSPSRTTPATTWSTRGSGICPGPCSTACRSNRSTGPRPTWPAPGNQTSSTLRVPLLWPDSSQRIGRKLGLASSTDKAW